nr:putative disease resistance protein rga3 [Quercus suber]
MRTINFSCKDWPSAEHSFINKPLVETCISRFKQLRLLNLRYPRLEELPSSISTLKHLRYLNLRGNKQIKKLPKSICNLQNLETLILRGCEELEELPRDIRKMISLRYLSITTKQTRFPTNGIECMCSLRKLYFDKCPKLESFPEGIQRLTALRFLGFQNCESLNSLPQGLKHLTALEVMSIQNCEKLNLMEGDDYPTSLRKLSIGREASRKEPLSLSHHQRGSKVLRSSAQDCRTKPYRSRSYCTFLFKLDQSSPKSGQAFGHMDEVTCGPVVDLPWNSMQLYD